MKKVIYYFSGTGNNIAVAKGLCEQIQDMEMYPITDLLQVKKIPEEYDLVGFSVPSYFSHVPPVIPDCIRNLQFADHQKVFSVIGCGGNRGHAAEDVRQLVEACGRRVNYEYMVIFPGSYILSYNAFPKWYQNPVLHHSKNKIRKIARQLMTAGADQKLGKGLFYNVGNEKALQAAISKYSQMGLAYTVSDDCTKCRRCTQICPVKNISMENGEVTFGAHCQQCMACIQWCPNRAIDYQGAAKDRTRYHHPDITVKDMI